MSTNEKRSARNRKRRRADVRQGRRMQRRGAATLDYVLVMAIIFPLALAMMTVVPRIVRLVYEFTVVQIGSPLM